MKTGNKFNITGKKVIGGDLFVNSEDPTGNIRVKLDPFPFSAPYQVLYTDYDNYSVVYSCSHFLGFSRQEFLWVFSRKPQEIDSYQYTTISNKALKLIDKKFNTTNTKNSKITDFSKS